MTLRPMILHTLDLEDILPSLDQAELLSVVTYMLLQNVKSRSYFYGPIVHSRAITLPLNEMMQTRDRNEMR